MGLNTTKRCITGSGLGLMEAPDQGAAIDAAGPDTVTRPVTWADGAQAQIHLLQPFPGEPAKPVAMIEAAPVERRRVPIAEFYAFEPMRPAPKPATEIDERLAPPELWAVPQPQPPGDDVISYIGDDGQLHYMIGAGLKAPQRRMSPKWRMAVIGAFRCVSEIVGMVFVLTIVCVVIAGVGMFLRWLVTSAGVRI